MSSTDFKKLSRELSGSYGISGSLLLIILITLVGSLLYWSSIAELDNVTRGNGKIVSSMQNQFVQSSEGGVIKARFFDKGELVNKGDILFEIDPIDAKTLYDQALQRLSTLKIKVIRLNAEILDEEPKFTEDLIEFSSAVVTGERALYNAKRADLNAQLAVLKQRLMQREQQIQEVKVSIETAEETLALVQKQISILDPLVKQGLSPENDLLSLYRQAKDFEGKKQTSEASLIRMRSSIEETQQEISSLLQSYRTKSQTELSSIVSEIAEVEYRLPALEDRLRRTQIKSPVKGVINRITFNTIGAFVKPGDTVLEIVPTGDDLIVEGRIDPKDIAYIQPDQKVKISLTAYDSSRYGSIEGKVLKVSADAVEEKSGISYYIVETSIDTSLYEDDGSEVEVLPGMVASVDVLAGKRTILDYLWQPMVKVKERAFTD